MKKNTTISKAGALPVIFLIFFFSLAMSYGDSGSGKGNTSSETPALSNDTSYTLFINNILMPLNHEGVFADVNVDSNNAGGRKDGKIFLFSGGFFLSGYDNGMLWANGVASASRIQDYMPGTTASGADDPRAKLYVLKKSDEPFGQSWQDWSDAVDLGAYYYDGDGSGTYNPVDLNSNGLWDMNEDRPDLLGDETVWCVYHDGVVDTLRRFNDVMPKGINIRQTVYAYDSSSVYKDVIFVRYSILNTGTVNQTLDEAIFTMWADPDIGDGDGVYDDLTGCDTLRNSGLAYNDGSDADWGVNPPCVMQKIIQGPAVYTGNAADTSFNYRGYPEGLHIKLGYKNIGLKAFMNYLGSHPTHGDPNYKEECRNYMEGLQRDGNPIDPCTWVYGKVEGGVNCSDINPHYLFSGDPVTQIGWLDDSPNDVRIMTSTGQFTLQAGVPVDIIVAYVVGQGADELESITAAKEIADTLQAHYDANISDMSVVGIDDEQVPDKFVLEQNYPNPFNPATTISYTLPEAASVKLTIYNTLGEEAAAIVNDFQQPGTYRVSFDAADLPSGVYFYRLQAGEFISTKKMLLMK